MVPLTVRSHYSLMWGTASVGRLVRAARRMGYTRLALTDTDNLYGMWPFLGACRREGLQPIVGAEVTDPGRPGRAVCLVATAVGYRNLCRLLTARHMDRGFSLVAALPDRAEGLVVLTRDPGLLAAWHDAGVRVAAAMPRRPLGASHPLRRLARRRGLPVVATPGSFFLEPDAYTLHRLLRAIDRRTSLSRLPANQVAPADAWLAPPDRYRQRFATCPEALAAAATLAEELSFTGPEFGLVMPPWPSKGDRRIDPDDALRRAAYRGARRRYGEELSEPVVERLEYELQVIARMGFSAYFLVVRDIVRPSSRTCGRGSGAASLVAYCLDITNVCPIKHNLYFERFLNPGRSDPPDIDVDFAWDERDAVQASVLATYGCHAAMVCNHIRFQPRMAVRETARVYGLTEGEIGRVTRRLPWYWRMENPSEEEIARVKAEWTERHNQVLEAGGLHIIGTERHESRRIDNQLRGRAGRQGDPGSSRFFLSLEDNLMRIFAPDRVKSLMQAMGMKKGEAIEHRMVTNAIEKSQRKVEGRNFDMRKTLLEYDDVANDQRTVIYDQRNEVMSSNDISDMVKTIREDVVDSLISEYIPPQSMPEQWDVAGLEAQLQSEMAIDLPVQKWLEEDNKLYEENLRQKILDEIVAAYEAKEEIAGSEAMRKFEKQVFLQVLDTLWKEHLSNMDHLRRGIHLRGYAQKNPKQEYKREAFNLFETMLDTMKRDVTRVLCHVRVQSREEMEEVERRRKQELEEELARARLRHDETSATAQSQGEGNADDTRQSTPETFVRQERKVGRNEPCPCGSGKKYKQCHGKVS